MTPWNQSTQARSSAGPSTLGAGRTVSVDGHSEVLTGRGSAGLKLKAASKLATLNGKFV